MDVLYIAVIVVLLLLIFKPTCSEGLTSKPTVSDVNKYTGEIIQNREVFGGKGTFYSAREKMPWIDPIAYEEVRQLARSDNLNHSSIIRVFN